MDANSDTITVIVHIKNISWLHAQHTLTSTVWDLPFLLGFIKHGF